MLQKLRRRAEDEKGFTLIELLVVILIIGILAAIAIPAFLNQRGKAYDASAKSQVKTAQTAEETYATDHNGTYTSLLADLTAIEPTLSDAGTGSSLTTVTGNTTVGYTLVSTASSTGDKFTLVSTSGSVARTCTAGTGGGNPGGCPSGGTW
jgi:type IV pilus assembly protein PilA